MSRLPAPVRLLRPQQWAKNLFVFAPLLFSGRFRDWSEVLAAAVAFALFCLASSVVYVLNDLLDIEADRAHPIKKFKRPLAAGQISVSAGWWILSGLATTVLFGLISFQSLVLPVGAYLCINLAYNLGLRALPVIDLVVISAGFVARVWAGAAVIDAPRTQIARSGVILRAPSGGCG